MWSSHVKDVNPGCVEAGGRNRGASPGVMTMLMNLDQEGYVRADDA
jgi:hypothetical protein